MKERRSGRIVTFLVRALTGMALIFFVNEVLAARGLDVSVGLNGISFLVSGVLGLPGIALLYGIVLRSEEHTSELQSRI